ncbi:MAG: YkgJ family cysteine cluster protein [Paraclostridium sp.]
MECRPKCGACCIAPSITSPIPGMEKGKPAGVRCIQLDENNMCKIFKDPRRPKVCGELDPCEDMCGNDRKHALEYLTYLEEETRPK